MRTNRFEQLELDLCTGLGAGNHVAASPLSKQIGFKMFVYTLLTVERGDRLEQHTAYHLRRTQSKKYVTQLLGTRERATNKFSKERKRKNASI